jgi:PAS domain S-box-containing protein
MRGILEKSAEAIIMTDRSGMISSFNVAAEEMFGFHRHEVVGSNVSMLMPRPYNAIHDRYVARHQESSLKENVGLGREAVAIRKDGTQFPIYLSLSETVISNNIIYTGIIRDLTQQKRLEKETLTRTLLEQKNKEITDSIRYAFQIQMAILPEKSILNKYMPDHFVFYRPKDIVSGDFYWFSRKEDKLFIAAIDCTGHGVPGAFMSLIGYTNLNKIVDEFGVSEPDVILASLDRYVTQSLQKNSINSDFKEGMDMALCCIDTKTNVVTYSGALRPMYIKRKGEIMEEITPNKNSIGGYMDTFHTPKEFVAHRIQLKKGDIFYIFTDGITDQFGGNESKKYSSRRFKEFLTNISPLPMEAQGLSLETEFDRWRSGQSQVDDVLVIGVQI